jgi:hypothetical protein
VSLDILGLVGHLVDLDIPGLVGLAVLDIPVLDIPAVLVSFRFVLLPVSVPVQSLIAYLYLDDLVLLRVFAHYAGLVDPVLFQFVAVQ